MDSLSTLLLLFAVIVAAVFGIIYIGNNTPNATDTWGTTSTNQTNSTQAIAGNATAIGVQVGGGAALLAAGVILIVVVGGLVWVALPKKRYGNF